MMVFASAGLLVLSTFAPAPLAMPIKAATAPLAITARRGSFCGCNNCSAGAIRLAGGGDAAKRFGGGRLLPYLCPAPRPAELGRWFPRGGRLAQVALVILSLGVAGVDSLLAADNGPIIWST